MQDFSGQGEALVGWRDSFYDLKPGFAKLPPMSTVLNARPCLARFAKSVWRASETFIAELEVRNLGEKAIPVGTTIDWSFAGQKGEVAIEKAIPPFELAKVGEVRLALSGITQGKQELVFGENRWSVWVFPDERPMAVPAGVTLTADPAVAKAALERGGRVIYTGESRDSETNSFRGVFWSAAWFFPEGRVCAHMGSCVDAAHPALAGFPTEDWTDFQWARLMENSHSHSLEGLSDGFEPIVRGVCDFHRPKSIGTLFELSVGAGRLLVCGYDLERQDPASIRMRNALLDYVASRKFEPKFSAPLDWIKGVKGNDEK